MMAADPDEVHLLRRLREGTSEELLSLIAAHAETLDVPAVCQALANPFANREVVERIASLGRLRQAQEVRRALVCHPAAPEVLALQLLPSLFWRDLAEISISVRLRPPLRVAAERALAERLPGLAEGEKMNLARRVAGATLSRLLLDPSRRVVAAALENPRLTEGLLYPLVRRETTLPVILGLIAENTRWGARYDLRVGLAQNPATPIETALRLLPGLKRSDLRIVAQAPRVPAPVRQRARLLCGQAG